MDSEIFEKLPPTRLFFRLAIPSMITMAFVSLYQIAGRIVCRFLAPGASEKAIEYGITYIRVYAIFTPLMMISHATDNYLRVCGKEKLSMWISVGTQALNIVLDIILIAFLHQGVWATAFTSCLAMSLSSVITLWLFMNKKMDLYYYKGKVERNEFFRILANGSSEFFSSISMSIMSVGFNFSF